MRDAEHLESAGPESVRMKVSAEFNGELGVLIDDFYRSKSTDCCDDT